MTYAIRWVKPIQSLPIPIEERDSNEVEVFVWKNRVIRKAIFFYLKIDPKHYFAIFYDLRRHEIIKGVDYWSYRFERIYLD